MAYDGSGMTQAYAGASMGMQDLYAGAQLGVNRMTADLGSMMPQIAAPNMHPMIEARHGLYAHEMSLSGSAMALMGRGIPETTTAYEYQEMAARDLGQRVAGAAVMGPFYAAAAGLSWFGGGAAMAKGFKTGGALARGAALNQMGYAKSIGGMKTLMRTGSTASKLGMRAAGVAGGVVGAIPALAAFGAISQFTEAVADDVKDRRDIMNFVEASSWRYTGSTGADIDEKHGGFNRAARAKIADTIKKVDYGDSRFDMGDLKGILESGTEMGMFNGVKDAEEFGAKFKELTSTLKKVTTTLHQSLAEGMKTIKGLKEMGFRSTEDMTSALMTADVLGTASGKTAAEMLSMGRQGSEMVRGTGVSMASGATMMMQNVSSIVGLKRGGQLSAEALAQVGGEGALAQQLMAGNINFMRSNMGKGISLALAGSEGGVDPLALAKLTSGGLSPNDIMNMGSKNVSTTGDYVKNFVNQGKRTREISEAYGGHGIELAVMGADITAAKSLQERNPSIDKEDAFRMAMMSRGLSDTAVEATIGKLTTIDKQRERSRVATKEQSSKLAGEMLRRRTNLSGRLGDWAHEKFISPSSRGLTSAYDALAGGTEKIYSGVRDWVQEEGFGIKKIELEDVKKKDILGIIAENASIGGPKVSPKLSSLDFTDDESEAFRKGKSEEYMELLGTFGGRAMSSKAMSARNIEQYSQTVFSKSWDSLSKNEKMFAENRIQRAGSENLKDEIDTRQEGAREQIAEKDIEYITGSDEKVKEAKKNMEKVVSGIGKKLGLAGLQSNVLSKVLSGDEKLSGKFTELLETKETLKGLKLEQTSAALQETEFTKGKELGLAMDKMDELTEDIAVAMEGEGSLGKAGASRLRKNMTKSDTSGFLEGFNETAEQVKAGKGNKAYRELIQGTKDGLKSYTSLKAGKFKETSDQDKYLDAMTKFKDSFGVGGKELGQDDYEDLAEYAGKGGLQSIEFLGRLGAKFEEAGGEMSPAKAALFLEETGNIKVDQDVLKKAFASKEGDTKISTKEIMEYATGREISPGGGIKVIGADQTDNQVNESAKAAVKLIEVQRRAEILINQYAILAKEVGIGGL